MTARTYDDTPVAAQRYKLPVSFPAWIVTACIFFNFGLCFINTNILSISPFEIILCEMGLVGMAAVYGFYRTDKVNLYWALILFLQILLLAILSLLRDEILLKPVRDVIIMPIFVALGLASARMNFTRFLAGLSTVILVIALWEAFDATRFLQIFNFKNYYIAKGAMDESVLVPLDTFASGSRPQGRFLFDFIDIHRISSVFLEPVSLGFYGFVSALYAMAVRHNISKTLYIFMLSLSISLIWLSDARMALGCLVIVFALKGLMERIDHRLIVLIAPLTFIAAYFLHYLEFLSVQGEGIGARINYTMILFNEINFEKLAGISGFELFTADSAAGEIIHSQGILGFLLYWLPPIFFLKKLSPQARTYLFGIAIYTSFAYLLSAAIFTIKTAALLWFGYGYIIARSKRLEEEEAAG